jgi:hypothetical protein
VTVPVVAVPSAVAYWTVTVWDEGGDKVMVAVTLTPSVPGPARVGGLSVLNTQRVSSGSISGLTPRRLGQVTGLRRCGRRERR